MPYGTAIPNERPENRDCRVQKHVQADVQPIQNHEVQGALTADQLESFASELDELARQVRSELGEWDAKYIQRVVRTQRCAELGGRALLLFGFLPPAWGGGVALLTLSKVLENMEIGHNVLHGQYDWMNDPELDGRTYEWDWACPAASWRHSHNYVHHAFTNVLGQDRDLGYALFRVSERQSWLLLNLPQMLYVVAQMLLFEWAVAVHDLEGDNILRGKKAPGVVLEELGRVVRKGSRQLFKDFVLFPLLAGPSAPFVFMGNLSANLIRNVWAAAVIYCGHFPEDVQVFSPEQAHASRGAWYFRQICGSANVSGSRWFHILTGHLSHQIEHHLYPDIPACRYPQMAPAVQRICRKYGVPYCSGPFRKQVGSALKRFARMSFPRTNTTAVA